MKNLVPWSIWFVAIASLNVTITLSFTIISKLILRHFKSYGYDIANYYKYMGCVLIEFILGSYTCLEMAFQKFLMSARYSKKVQA